MKNENTQYLKIFNHNTLIIQLKTIAKFFLEIELNTESAIVTQV